MKRRLAAGSFVVLFVVFWNWVQPGVSWAGKDASAAAKTPSQDDIRRARVLFGRGKAFFSQGKYRAAANAFEDAYQLHKHKAIAYNLAVTHAMLGHDKLAVTYLREFLRQEKSPPPLPDVLKKAQAKVGVVVVSVANAEGVIFVNGREVGKRHAEKVVDPGRVVVEVRLENRVVAHKELLVMPGRETVYEFSSISEPGEAMGVKGKVVAVGRAGGGSQGRGEGRAEGPRHAKSYQRLHWAYFTTAAALTLGLAAGAVATGVMAKRAYDDYQDDPTDASLRNKGINLVKTTNILWGATAGMAVTAVILAVFTRWHNAPAKEGESQSVTATPMIAPGGGGVIVTIHR